MSDQTKQALIAVVAAIALVLSLMAVVRGGTQGVQGPSGPAGVQGVSGPAGVQGVQGPVGLQGAAGIPGAQGIPGPQGPAGPQGIKGDRGDRGERGDTGVASTTTPYNPYTPTGYGSYQVASSADDCVIHISGQYFSLTDTSVSAGATGGVVGGASAMQFATPDMPQNATISSASLQIYTPDAITTTGMYSYIMGGTMASPITAYGDFVARPRTGARIDWSNPAPWPAGQWVTAPDITAVLQEIVRSPTYAGRVLIFWSDEAMRSVSTGFRYGASFDKPGGAYAPKLVVTWR